MGRRSTVLAVAVGLVTLGACGGDGSDAASDDRTSRSTTASSATTTLLPTTTSTPLPTTLEVTTPDGYRYGLSLKRVRTFVQNQPPGMAAYVATVEARNLLPDRSAPFAASGAFQDRIGLGLKCTTAEAAGLLGTQPLRIGDYCLVRGSGCGPEPAAADAYPTGDPTQPGGVGTIGNKCIGGVPESAGIDPTEVAAFFWDPNYVQPWNVSPIEIVCLVCDADESRRYVAPELWQEIPSP